MGVAVAVGVGVGVNLGMGSNGARIGGLTFEFGLILIVERSFCSVGRDEKYELNAFHFVRHEVGAGIVEAGKAVTGPSDCSVLVVGREVVAPIA